MKPDQGYTLIQAWGHWLSDNEPLCATVAKCHRKLTVGEFEYLMDHSEVLYIINHDERIGGLHDDFVITAWEVC